MGFSITMVVLLIIAFCAWQGYRKGLILTVASIAIVIISAAAAGQIASAFAEDMSSKVAHLLNWIPDTKIDAAVAEIAKGMGPLTSITDNNVLSEIAAKSFENIGITGAVSDKLVAKTMSLFKLGDVTIREAISNTFLYSISYLIVCVFGFLVVFISLTLLVHFLASVFKIPGFRLIDKIAGAVLGLIFGLLIMNIVGWVMQFIGVFIPPEIAESSGLLMNFIKSNIFGNFLTMK